MTTVAEAALRISTECACQRVREASRTLTRIYDELLRPCGVQASQLTVLVATARFGEKGATLSALADVLVMDRTTLTRNLAPLERADLLRVARSPHDARLRVIFLTREGERVIERAYPLWLEAQERVHALVGKHEATALREQLAELVSVTNQPAARPAARKRR